MFKSTKLYSILFNKCPRCHEGDLFVRKGAFNREFDKMHKRCSHCGQDFEPETGFYFGSMYVSYAFYVATVVTAFVGFVVIFEFPVEQVLVVLIPLLVLLTPLYFRVARRVWINFFVSYQKPKAQVETSV
ncbi:MAG: DUF983 domain-containing protein [Spirosomataceae bacterium]